MPACVSVCLCAYYVCMYVCMCVYMPVCLYTRMYACMCVRKHVHLYACVRMYHMCICMHMVRWVCTYVHVEVQSWCQDLSVTALN